MYYLLCLMMFLLTYVISLTYTSVFYHRAWAHRSLDVVPWLARWVGQSGIWVTGLDPKAWVCMHRHHHMYSDTASDPHSPTLVGLCGVLFAQKRSYELTLEKLLGGDKHYNTLVHDLPFAVNTMYRHSYLWLAPYLFQTGLGVCIGLLAHAPLLGAAYVIGILSHPIQGWAVNALGHAVGHRNFATADNSRNNHVIGWLVMGEGYQNNHHRFPSSSRFSFSRWELDLGYVMCILLEKIGVVAIHRNTLISAAALRQQAA